MCSKGVDGVHIAWGYLVLAASKCTFTHQSYGVMVSIAVSQTANPGSSPGSDICYLQFLNALGPRLSIVKILRTMIII